MLWDTAGQEEFDAITKAYYRGAQACVLAFSTTDRDSFEAAHSWKMKVRTHDPLTLSPEGTRRDRLTFWHPSFTFKFLAHPVCKM